MYNGLIVSLSVTLQPKSGFGRLVLRFIENTHTHTHTQDSPEQVINPSQMLLLRQQQKTKKTTIHALSGI